jgi:hypothetical protein
MLLATQNPVDIDYKGLSNAGTWFVGRLQTDQDKQRLLDGLVSAGGNLDRAELDRQISALAKRVFLLHNVHQPRPVLFQTRWTMNYLAGPMTRAQIPALNRLAQTAGAPAPASAGETSAASTPVRPAAASPAAPVPVGPSLEGSTTRPPAPTGVTEYFYPNNLTLSEAAQAGGRRLSPQAKNLGILYRPALVAQAQLRYLDRKYGLDYEQRRAALVREPDRRGYVRWDDSPGSPVNPQHLERTAVSQARFMGLDAPFTDARTMNAIQKDFLDWVYRTSTLRLRANETLKVYAGPDVSPAEFKDRCSQAARKSSEAEIAKVSDAYDRKLAALQTRLAREERELDQDEEEHSQRKMEELGKGVENVLGLFGGRKRSLTTSLTKRRMTQQSKADVDESRKAIADLKRQIADLEKEKAAAVQEVSDRWAQTVVADGEVSVTPMKKDIFLDLFGLAWLPFYIVQDGENQIELPAFG